ncbi:alpha/beta-hydrolase [Cristinia sonorae]|uniref:Alpha/beta-hydrolase n=1 Tax=Cristinia sonorae TaxID=1940300 RepID=A0A8K0XU74_9AGAR|nr:alpha/beta-hydrolase [Cristinia sonorae]
MATETASSSSVIGNIPLPPARDIPSTFTASLRSWWSAGEKEGAASEERLLRKLSYFRSSLSSPSSTPPEDSPVVAHSTRVELTDPKHYINTFAIQPTKPSDSAPPPAVLLHGYGAGLGFFYQNFPALGRWAGNRGTSVYALDWLGMGRSARVPFRVKAKREDISARVAEAEAFFVDSLEDWRAKMGLEKMTLVGHSLGGYLSTVYALKYPSRVNKLILLSPAGVPRGPEEEYSREIMDAQTTGASSSDSAEPASRSKVEAMKEGQRKEIRKESKARKVFTYLWEEGFSPFQVVRSSLFWGPMLVGKYSSRRFIGLSAEDTKDMHEYILNITLAKGSGEYCISHLLAPGAFARRPIVDRINALKIPVTFVYGDNDWMDPEGGSQSVENMRQAGNGQGRMYIVPHAGHHLYLDNPKATNDLLIKELDRHHS